MDDDRIQTYCTVSGIESFVFRLSKLAAIAPLEFESEQDGWRMRVSWRCDMYNRTIVTFFMILTIIPLMVELGNTENTFRTKHSGSCLLWTSDVLIVGAVVVFAAYTGVKRMNYNIDCIVQLKQVNKDLQLYHPVSAPREIKKWILVITSLIYAGTTMFMDYGIYMNRAIREKYNVKALSLYIFYYIMYLQMHVVMLNIVFVTIAVLPSLHAINSSLKRLLQRMYSYSSYPEPVITVNHLRTNIYSRFSHKSVVPVEIINRDTEDSRSPSIILNRLVNCYCSLCNIVKTLDEANGSMLVLLILCLLIHIVFTCYHYFAELVHKRDYKNFSSALQLSWMIYHFIRILILIEPFHRTHSQMSLTRTLINNMLRYTTADDFAVNAELKGFLRHLLLNPTTYSPMQLFTLNRRFLITLLGTIATYLVVIVQL